MLTNIRLFFFLLLPISVWGQTLDIDSLKRELGSFIQIKSKNGWNAYTVKYLSQDSLVIWQIPYNAAGVVEADVWDLAFYFKKYDYKGRDIESRYYDINGNLHFTDWPPVMRTYYDDKDNTIRTDYFGEDEKQVARFEYTYDSQNRTIELREFDGQLTLTEVTRYEYRDAGKMVLERVYDRNNKLKKNEDGVSVLCSVYLSDKRDMLIERRFMDKNEQLVHVKDKINKMEYARIVYTYGLRDHWIKVDHYDVTNRHTGEIWQYDPDQR